MGIDIYAEWDGQTAAEKDTLKEVWLAGDSGRVGYLREAYHGEPYATRYLVPEAFDQPDGAFIPAATLRERLPETLRLAEERDIAIYFATGEEIEATLRSYREFVELCERKEMETGKPVKILASW